MDRFRVGVDFHTFDGIYQGSRSHILGLFKEAVVLAPEIEFVFFLNSTERLLSEYPEFNNPNVTLICMTSRPSLWRLAVQLPMLQKRHALGLLHTQYRLPFLPLGPCACTIHDVLFESHPEYFSKFFTWQSKLSFRIAAYFSTLLFTVSDYSKQQIVQRYSVDPEKIQVVYNGVDFSRFHPGDLGRERLAEVGLQSRDYILNVGRLEPRKNHVRLIEAYAKLEGDVPPLVCVGQRDFGYDQALSLVNSLGLQDRVKFLEHVDDRLLPILMRHARFFVFPAIAEGFGMPVAEALASGVPVLTSNTTSMPEVAGAAAILVDPLDADSIARGMDQLLSDTALSQRLVEDGLQQVQKFDWRHSAAVLVETYRSYIAQARRA